MSFYNFLRGFFGMPPEGNNNRFPEHYPDERPNEFRNPIWSLDDDDDDDDDFRRPRNRFSFHIDSNPLEIHRFFEQQMESIMRSFGQFGFGNFGGDMFSLEPPPMDVVPVNPDPPTQGGSLRGQFLKPGYEQGFPKAEKGKRVDSDLDDKMSVRDVGKMLQEKPPGRDLQPRRAFPFGMFEPHMFGSGSSQSYGRSMSSKTVSRPNGGVEHHKSVRDSTGNEEVTVTRTLGSQSYSVTTKTDANGKQERIENFVNMDEGDLKDFEKKWGSKL